MNEITAAATGSHDVARLWGPACPATELSVVVPFYNPGDALRPTVERLVACLTDKKVAYEVIAVSDGSTDGSEHSLHGIPGVTVIVNPVNQGKGAALHLGFSAARGSWIGFIDADGDIDPDHLAEYLHIARSGGHSGVYADKRHAASSSGATSYRKLISVFYSTFVTTLFRSDVRDTQTGCKLVRRDALATLLPRLRERRFAFDLELFVAAKAAGIADFHSAPVRLETRRNGSSVNGRAILRTIRDTVTIWARHLRGHYHATTTDSAVPTVREAELDDLRGFASAA